MRGPMNIQTSDRVSFPPKHRTMYTGMLGCRRSDVCRQSLRRWLEIKTVEEIMNIATFVPRLCSKHIHLLHSLKPRRQLLRNQLHKRCYTGVNPDLLTTYLQKKIILYNRGICLYSTKNINTNTTDEFDDRENVNDTTKSVNLSDSKNHEVIGQSDLKTQSINERNIQADVTRQTNDQSDLTRQITNQSESTRETNDQSHLTRQITNQSEITRQTNDQSHHTRERTNKSEVTRQPNEPINQSDLWTQTRSQSLPQYYREVEIEDFTVEEPEIAEYPGMGDETPQTFTRGKDGVFDLPDIVNLLESNGVQEIAALRVPPECQYVDHLVIGTCRSPRHTRALAEIVRITYKKMRAPKDPESVRIEGHKNDDWIAVDLGNLALHLFMADTRALYDLESLWALGEEHDEQSQAYVSYTQSQSVVVADSQSQTLGNDDNQSQSVSNVDDQSEHDDISSSDPKTYADHGYEVRT